RVFPPWSQCAVREAAVILLTSCFSNSQKFFTASCYAVLSPGGNSLNDTRHRSPGALIAQDWARGKAFHAMRRHRGGMNIWLVIALAKRHGYEAALHQAKPNVGYTIP